MHLQFAALPVFDQDRTMAFYTENLGCALTLGWATMAGGGSN